MGKREYKLPKYGDLNKDQDKVVNLPKDGQFLIVGGPGTGKSIVAILRASNSQNDKNYLYLTFNHVLNTATIQLTPFSLESDVILTWFYNLQYDLTGEMMPQAEEYKPDYEKVIKIFEGFNSQTVNKLHLIIDEGQDMPPGFYEALISLGYENYFIVADQNQQITEYNSSRQELTDILGLETEDVIELNENYRNSAPIAKLAQYFYTDKSSPKPYLPDKPSLDTPVLYEYTLVRSCVEIILREADRDNSKLIGLFVATETKREDYFKQLKQVDIERDNEKPVIESYSSQEKQAVNINFGQGGVVVLNDKSVKGIEFDVVYIVLDGFKLFSNDVESIKKRFYVMISRAKEKLFILKSELYRDGVDTILPTDESILRRDKI
jgi:superfamily I DNA/RNA helicase